MLASAKNWSKANDIEHKIEFIQADFLTMRNLRADAVFLNPPVNQLQEKQAFSVLGYPKLKIQKLIEHSISIAENVCIKLPYNTQTEEVGVLFARIFDSNST